MTPRTAARSRRRRTPARRSFSGWRWRMVLIAAVLVAALLSWAALARRFAPAANTGLTRFDALLVFGSPADPEGNPTPAELATVDEAVHEYERGVAPRLIFTGGAAHNRFVEAQVMARAARSEGIPDSAIVLETESKDTIQNGCNSVRIMKAHGWTSAELVSDAGHLPRIGLIFDRLPIQWRLHAAPPLVPESALRSAGYEVVEILKTAHYLVWAREMERCQP